MPLHFTSALENTEAMAQETVVLSCELSKPGEEVTWLKNNVPLSMTDDRYETVNQDTTYQLIIPSVTKDDSGEYTVQAGELQSTAQLTVLG